MKILITAAAGYIGSHAAAAIEKSGHTPIIFDTLSAGHKWAVGSKTLIEADLSDRLSRAPHAGFPKNYLSQRSTRTAR